MTREITVLEAPIQDPFICAKCGVGAGDRPYFVDLGIDNEFVIQNAETKLPHYTMGVVYFCSECMQNAFSVLNRLVFQFINARINSNLNVAEEKAQAFEIQLQENAHLKKELDRVNEELKAAKDLYQTAFLNKVHSEEVQATAEDLLVNLLGAEEIEPGTVDADNSDAAGDDSDFEGDSSDSEPDNSDPPVDPNAIRINLSGLGT